jgi:hypothetical protein
VRLSPKSIFFGLVAFGLPVSVAIGWTLATPPKGHAAVGASAGTGLGAGPNGVLGPAPRHGGGTQPLTEVQYSPRPIRSAVLPPVASAPSAAPTPTTAPPIVVLPSVSSLPTLDQPPVPTPTEITTTPSASTDPSTSTDPSAQPSS